jgi:hypothetical protein
MLKRMNTAKAWYSKNALKVLGGAVITLLVALLLVIFWPVKNVASVPQEVVSAPGVSLSDSAPLKPSEEFFFRLPATTYTSTGDLEPAVMVSKSTGHATPIPGAVHYGGGIYEGHFGPVISRSGNYLAYRNDKDRAIVVMDTYGNRKYLPSASIVGKETDVDTGIHDWSPDETRLMFTVSQITTGCMEEGYTSECGAPKGVPSDIRLGYHVADFASGEVTFLAGVATSTDAYYFKGWIDGHTLLFEQENVLFEYDLKGSRLVRSLKFKEPGTTEIHHFSFVGMGIRGTQVYMYGKEIYSGSPIRLVVRRGLSETILAEYGWAQIQPRDARLSEDGRYVIWKVEGGDEEHRFDLETL